jgi:hypothetical protein
MVTSNLYSLLTEPQALLELVKKCGDANYQLKNGSATLLLRTLGLVQPNSTIDQEVQKVVLCSVKCSHPDTKSLWVKIINPSNGTPMGSVIYGNYYCWPF